MVGIVRRRPPARRAAQAGWWPRTSRPTPAAFSGRPLPRGGGFWVWPLTRRVILQLRGGQLERPNARRGLGDRIADGRIGHWIDRRVGVARLAPPGQLRLTSSDKLPSSGERTVAWRGLRSHAAGGKVQRDRPRRLATTSVPARIARSKYGRMTCVPRPRRRGGFTTSSGG